MLNRQIVQFVEAATEAHDLERLRVILTEDRSLLSNVDSSGNSLLHIASATGNSTLVTILLELGVNIDLVNHLGQSALHVAVTNNREDVVELLLQRVRTKVPCEFS